MSQRWRGWIAVFGLGAPVACFGNPGTLGLPCTEDAACFDAQVCGPQGVCIEASDVVTSTQGESETGDGDGDTGDGDGDTGDGDGDTGDGDGDTGDPMCGNGIREQGEICDGMDLNDSTCADFGFGGGMLACDQCEFDLTDCCMSTGQACQLSSDCCDGMACLGIPPLNCG